MNVSGSPSSTERQHSSTEHIDVVIVGAGLSGIGAAHHLTTLCPDRDFTILEGRERLGGTWDLFRYPGVRSDSDMHTLGYGFRPWTEQKSIADGPSILKYINDTAEEAGIVERIRFGHRVTAAHWNSQTARWTLEISNPNGDPASTLTCNFLLMCSGYFSYRGGYRPEFPGEDEFEGLIVHPQEWPEDLDYREKQVIIIGSGATAITLVPAMAERASHVVMLQRSPTYVVSRPDEDRLAQRLRRVLPERLAYRIIRAKNTWFQQLVYRRTRTNPDSIRGKLLDGVRAGLGPDYDIDTHFSPSYNPWDQRLCLIPNGDLFTAIRSGQASVVTDRIRCFDSTGIQLESGQHLDADIIVTATGLQLVTLGEMEFSVDGEPIDFARTWTYKGLAYSGVPNLISTFGYISASWTLRADLVSQFACRVLNHLRHTGTDQVTPLLRPTDHEMSPRPWIADFSAGYIERMLPLLPKQGDRQPWVNTQDYAADRRLLLKDDIEDGVLIFTRVTQRAVAPAG